MPYSNFGKDRMLDALGVTHISLHTADPGDTGANEVTGGSPAYARKPITIAAAASGVAEASDQPEFDVPAGTTVAYVGFWDDASAGHFLGSSDVTDEVFAGQGTYTVSAASLDLNS